MENYRTYILTALYGSHYDIAEFSKEHAEANRERLNTLFKYKWDYIGLDRSIAKLLKISNTQMSRILNCYSSLSLETAVKLAWLCNTTVDHILKLEKDLGMLDEKLTAYIK